MDEYINIQCPLALAIIAFSCLKKSSKRRNNGFGPYSNQCSSHQLHITCINKHSQCSTHHLHIARFHKQSMLITSAAHQQDISGINKQSMLITSPTHHMHQKTEKCIAMPLKWTKRFILSIYAMRERSAHGLIESLEQACDAAGVPL